MTNRHYKEEDEGHGFSKNWDTYVRLVLGSEDKVS